MNLSSVPPCSNTMATMRVRYSSSRRTTSALSIFSDADVKSRTSENRMVTSRCSLAALAPLRWAIWSATAGEK